MSGLDDFMRLLEQHPIEGLHLDGGMWLRLTASIDRQNHDRRTPDDCKLDPEDPEDIAIKLCSLIEQGLEVDEAEYGLAGTVFGGILSREQMAEAQRRRRDKRGRHGKA